MSDRDPLQQLADFRTGPVTPLPAADVRRLGDRRRARRTATTVVAGAAAVLAVAVPVGLKVVSNGDSPEPPPTTTSPTMWRTDIPAEVPLLTGLPERDNDGARRVTITDQKVIDDSGLCGTPLWSYDGVVTHRDVDFQDPEDSRPRVLATYADDAAAQEALKHARDAAEGCAARADADGITFVRQTWPQGVSGADEAVVATLNYAMSATDETFMPGQSTWVLMRVGNAVYTTIETNEGGSGPDGAEPGITEALDDAPAIAAWMCIYAADPCGSTDGTDDAPGPEQVPADFPLDRDPADLGPTARREGPSANVAVAQPLPCSIEPLTSSPIVDRLGWLHIGEEFEEHRQLLIYADEASAARVIAEVNGVLDRCPTEPDQGMTLTWMTHYAETGYGSLTFSQGVEGGVGGTTFQLTRIGRAILQIGSSSEGNAELNRLSGDTRAIAPDMCIWAVDGCDGQRASTEETRTGASGDADIPDEFPLAAGFPARSENGAAGYIGPNRTIEPGTIDACGAALPDPVFRDRLLARYESAEDYRTRQLTTYWDAEAAAAASRTLVEAFRSCREDRPEDSTYNRRHEVKNLYLGGESWAVLTRLTSGGRATPFGSTIVVVRVGRAVLIETHDGHAGYPSDEGISELTGRLAGPLAAMCAFTAKGC